MARKLEVQIVGDASSLQRALGSAGKSTNTFGNRLKTATKYAGAFLGAAGIGGMAVTLKRGFSEMADAQKVAAQTGAVLKSTAGAANITARGVDNLAGSLSKMSGVDDEAIASGENLLLTFTNIRNEVGKGNDVFNQATAAALDMSVALGTDVTTSAMQLGKALNDPAKGMTRLQRIGVTFTKGQIDAVKAMQASGDRMGAQKVILAELNKEFGGSAKAAGETFPGQLAKLRNSFDEAAGALVTRLLPYLTRFVEFISTNMPTIEATMSRVFGAIGATVTTLIGIFNQVKGPIKAVFDFLRGGSDASTAVIASLAGLGGGILAAVAIIKTITAVTKAWTFAQAALNIVMATNPFVLIIAGLIALGAALVVLYMKSERFRDIVNGAFAAVKGVVMPIIDTLRELWKRFGDDVLSIATRVFNALKPAIMVPLQTIIGAIKVIVALFKGDWQTAWEELKEIPLRMLRAAVALVRGLVGLWLDAAKALGSAIIRGITAGLAALGSTIRNLLAAIPGAIATVAATVYSAALEIGKRIISGVVDGLSGLAGAVKDKAEGMIKGALSSLNPFSPVEHGGAKFIGEPIVRGAIQGLENLSSTFTAKTSEVTKKAVEGALTTITSAQGKFKDAWSNYGDAAVAAFDDIAAKIQTPAEKALATMQRLREAGEIKTAVSEAQAGLATAQAGGDPAAILQAQKTLDEALYRQKEYGLQQRAILERAKLDEQIEVNRLKFEQWLATRTVQQQQELTKEGTGQKKIVGHINSFGKDWAQAGRNLGAGLAEGLRDARGWVVDAANELAAAINSAIGAASQARSSAKTISQNITTRLEGRAGGGPVRGGTPYIVGERGPELFIPNASGLIQANQSPRNIPGGIIFHQYVQGSVVTERQLVEMVREEIIRLGRYNAGGVLGGVG